MVGLKPAGSINKGQVTFLEDQAQKIEEELEEQRAFLESLNVGMTEPLVDDEGIPRTDIDIYKVRNVRQRIICLQNDFSLIMNRIKRGLVQINPELRNPLSNKEGFSLDALTAACASKDNQVMDRGEPSQSKFVINEGTQAFAVIESVDPNSPAEKAGLMADDQLLQFGTLTHLNFYEMSQIQDTVTNNIGQNILIKIRRQRNVLCLTITPCPWSQPGLLGCRINRL